MISALLPPPPSLRRVPCGVGCRQQGRFCPAQGTHSATAGARDVDADIPTSVLVSVPCPAPELVCSETGNLRNPDCKRQEQAASAVAATCTKEASVLQPSCCAYSTPTVLPQGRGAGCSLFFLKLPTDGHCRARAAPSQQGSVGLQASQPQSGSNRCLRQQVGTSQRCVASGKGAAEEEETLHQVSCSVLMSNLCLTFKGNDSSSLCC